MMVEAVQIDSNRTEWSKTLGLKITNLLRQIKTVPDSVEVAKELALEGHLHTKWGSRSLAWRIFLGLLPVSGEVNAIKVEWVKQTRAIRQKWVALEKSISLIVIAKQTKNFNPLAPPKVVNDEKA